MSLLSVQGASGKRGEKGQLPERGGGGGGGVDRNTIKRCGGRYLKRKCFVRGKEIIVTVS